VSTSLTHQNKKPPMYDMPYSMDHTSKGHPLEKVSTIKNFLQSCVKLLNDPSFVKVLTNLLEICNTEIEGNLEQKTINHLHTRRRTRREFILNASIGYFNMGDIIMDLVSKVNALPKKTWKCMG
jgi:Golgi nucleoside diphosphatase